MLYDNQFLFFRSFEVVIQIPTPLVYFDTLFIKFRNFSRPPVYYDPPFIWNLRVRYFNQLPFEQEPKVVPT